MKDWTIYWQDMVAMFAGLLLMAVFAVAMGSLTVGSGWLVYLCGGLSAMLAAGGFQDQDPVLSWAAAFFGVVLLITGLAFHLPHNQGLIRGMVAGGGAVIAALSAWSAVLKKGSAAKAA